MNKETQRWLTFSVTSLEKLINISGELNKTYMSYKIHYGVDLKLKGLTDDLSSSDLDFGLENYEPILDLKVLKEIRSRNSKKLKEKVTEILKPKKEILVAYLNEKIKEI